MAGPPVWDMGKVTDYQPGPTPARVPSTAGGEEPGGCRRTASGRGGRGAALFSKRGKPPKLPLVPHVVDLGLEVLEVFLDEVGEPALLEKILAHGLARSPLGDGLGLAVVANNTVFYFVEREDAGLHRQLPQLVREHGVVVPALGARIERVDEGRAADGKGLANLVHHLDPIGRA